MHFRVKKVRSRVRHPSSSNRARLRLEELESRLVPYALSGSAWPHPGLVTIGFVPDGTDLGGVSSNLVSTLNARFSQSYWQKQVLKAVQVWAQQTNLNFAVLTDDGDPIGSGPYQQGDPLLADIRIGGYNFGTSTLARAYLPPQANNFSIAGDIHFNTAQSWVIGTTGGYDLFTVAMHEVGHALGLLHSSNYFSALYPTYVGSRVGLGADDISGIRAVYSAGQARAVDSYDAAGSNGTFSTATSISSLIDSGTLTALAAGRDITTTGDVDYYAVTAPAGTSGTLTVRLQSSGLSLLAPTLTVYNGSQQQIGYASGANQYGTTVAVTITGVAAGQVFYIKAAGAEATAFGTGRYALTLNFGTGASPTVPLSATQTLNGTPLQSSGTQAEEPDHDHDPDFAGGHDPIGGCCCPSCGGRRGTASFSGKAQSPITDPDAGLITGLDTGSPADGKDVAGEGVYGGAAFSGDEIRLLGSEVSAPGKLAAPAEMEEAAAPAGQEQACDACFADDRWLAELSKALTW